MAEQTAEKKKPAIIKRLFKWIGLGLLSLLLIAGLIFQAPWKVTVLLLVILLACTALPRPLRKWFWLSIGTVIIVLLIWVFLPDRGEWRPYTFDEELAALEAKPAIPDSENAAIVYNKLLEDYDPNAMHLDFLDHELDYLTCSEPWSSKDYPELAQRLKAHQRTVTKLLEASKIKKCRFPIAADSIAIAEHMKILAPMRRWTFLLSRAANNDLGEGRIDQALQKQIAILQMAKHLYQQPILIDFLVGMAIEALVTKQLDRFVIVDDATEAHLSVIEKAMAEIKHDWSYDLPRILEGEKLLAKNTLAMLAYEVNPKGQVRLSHDPTATIRAQFAEIKTPQTYWQRKLTKAGTVLGWFCVPSTPQRLAKMVDDSYEKYYAMAEPDFDWQRQPKQFSKTPLKFNYRYVVQLLVDTSQASLYGFHDAYLRTKANQRGSHIIIALRHYKNKNGRWPDSLDDVKSFAPAEAFVDPVNKSNLVYKPTDQNFMLYSKGKNNIDEHGEYKFGADDCPIWPRWTRKFQERNSDAKRQ